MIILALFQFGYQSLTDNYTQASLGVSKVGQHGKKFIEATQRRQMVENLELNLHNLSEKGTSYNRVIANFEYRGNPHEAGCSAFISVSHYYPRQDDAQKFIDSVIGFDLDYSSWKNLARDIGAFSIIYKNAYAKSYGADEIEMKIKMRRLNSIFSPFLKRAAENIGVEKLTPPREFN